MEYCHRCWPPAQAHANSPGFATRSRCHAESHRHVSTGGSPCHGFNTRRGEAKGIPRLSDHSQRDGYPRWRSKTNCSDVDRLLSEGIELRELQVRAGPHIRNCPRCRPLVEFIAESIEAPHDENDSSRKIAARLTSNLAPAKPLASTG